MFERHGDRIEKQSQALFLGRIEELHHLWSLLDDDGPAVVFVHGIGGIGKTTLMNRFVGEIRQQAVVIQLDCRSIKPSESGFLDAINGAIDTEYAGLEAGVDHLANLGDTVLMVLDTYELFRMMDTWLRETFIPMLHQNIKILILGREAPVMAWNTTPGWQGLFKNLRLEGLGERDAKTLLQVYGAEHDNIAQITHFAKGHPLALKLAAAMLEHRDFNISAFENHQVVAYLAQLYLEDVSDPATRQVLEAASVVRRITRSLLGAMLSSMPPSDSYDRLISLPFVEHGNDGLIIHDMVRHTISSVLKAADPDQYYAYRRAAWRQLQTEFQTIGSSAIWRYTADMIYLIEQPTIHEAFFPNDTHLYAVQRATPDDIDAILAIAMDQCGAEMCERIAFWREHIPSAFNVARSRNENVAGYYCSFRVEEVAAYEWFENDPITYHWWQHLQANPVPPEQQVLFSPHMVAAETGEEPSIVQSAFWLDIKRTYMQYLNIRRVYTMIHNVSFWLPILEELGFQVITGATVELDGRLYTSVVNDLGDGLVMGWLAGLVDAALEIPNDEPLLDVGARELIVEHTRISLTPLEFELMRYLYEREGQAIDRNELLDQVWGYDYAGGSNVVDGMVRSLRRKLGDKATCIETVTGVGYLFRDNEPSKP